MVSSLTYRPSPVAITISILLFSLVSIVSAHSNLGSPIAYNFRSCRIVSPWCERKACPPIRKGQTRNSIANPAAVWKRGQRVPIVWHKNNHNGGFYRRSLVPVKHMYDLKMHEKTAFDYGCWSQGTFKCTGNKILCGTDKQGRAYRNYITVPSIFPDGDYTLGHVWYGGLHYLKKYPNHSDYFACSFIRIEGGEPLTKTYKANWSGKNRKCLTGSTKPLQCGGHCGDACGGPKCPASAVKYTVPDEWRNGAVPEIKLVDFNPSAAANLGEEQVVIEKANQSPSNTAVVADGKKETPVSKSVLKSVNVYVDYKFSKAVYDGEEAVIDTEGKDVSIEVFTAGKVVGTVSMLINGKVRWQDRRGPYVFQGNNGKNYNKWNNPILNKKFTFGAFITQKGKKVSINVGITLTKK